MSLIHQSQPIPLNKLKPSKANVRKTGRDTGIEELAASIAAHGLLHPLTIAPEMGKDGEPTGHFGVIAGGRRLAALKLLAKRKALPKTAPVPCVTVDDGGTEISLAENINQAPMRPADQFEAFAALQAQGLTAEDIGARFSLTARAVRQRLRLGAASPRLMALYREGDITLDQLTAFCLTDDHAAQERVWDCLSYNKEPYLIRRLLTEGQVPLTDRRTVFVGMEAYEAAGGIINRDLFSQDEGQGYITDVPLLEQLVADKLNEIARAVRAEGWKWVNVSPEFDRREFAGLHRVHPQYRDLSEDEQQRLDALEREYEAVAEDQPDFEAEVARLEAEIEALRGEAVFDPDHLALGGAWVSLGDQGNARIERGFIRPQDLAPADEPDGDTGDNADADILDQPTQERDETEADTAQLPERLLSNLSAHRTAALRHRLAARPDIAYLAVLHAFVLHAFYWGNTRQTCLDISLRYANLATYADNLKGSTVARENEERHERWAQCLPKTASALWSFIIDQTPDDRTALLAHCAALTLEALHRPAEGTYGKNVHADQLVEALGLDMTAYWQPTEESYFARITKAQICEAICETKGEAEAGRMAGMKKPDMAKRAERLLAGSGWLPLPLRSPEPPVNQPEARAA